MLYYRPVARGNASPAGQPPRHRVESFSRCHSASVGPAWFIV